MQTFPNNNGWPTATCGQQVANRRRCWCSLKQQRAGWWWWWWWSIYLPAQKSHVCATSAITHSLAHFERVLYNTNSTSCCSGHKTQQQRRQQDGWARLTQLQLRSPAVVLIDQSIKLSGSTNQVNQFAQLSSSLNHCSRTFWNIFQAQSTKTIRLGGGAKPSSPFLVVWWMSNEESLFGRLIYIHLVTRSLGLLAFDGQTRWSVYLARNVHHEQDSLISSTINLNKRERNSSSWAHSKPVNSSKCKQAHKQIVLFSTILFIVSSLILHWTKLAVYFVCSLSIGSTLSNQNNSAAPN